MDIFKIYEVIHLTTIVGIHFVKITIWVIKNAILLTKIRFSFFKCKLSIEYALIFGKIVCLNAPVGKITQITLLTLFLKIIPILRTQLF